MNERENEVIDIATDRNETSIEMNSSTQSVEPELIKDRTSFLIFDLKRKIVIGSALLICLIVPLLTGVYISFMISSHLREPVDPNNIWPATEFTRRSSENDEDEIEDLGYSTAANNLVLLKNGEDDFFTFKSLKAHEPPHYMSVYMIENLYGDRDRFGLYVITNFVKKLTKSHNLFTNYVSEDDFINNESMTLKLVDGNYGKSYGINEDKCISNSLTDTYKSFEKSSNLQVIKHNISIYIQEFVDIYTKKNYRNITNSYSYTFPRYFGLDIPSLKHLQFYRNNLREKKEKEKELAAESEESYKPVVAKKKKPRFTRINVHELKPNNPEESESEAENITYLPSGYCD